MVAGVVAVSGEDRGSGMDGKDGIDLCLGKTPAQPPRPRPNHGKGAGQTPILARRATLLGVDPLDELLEACGRFFDVVEAELHFESAPTRSVIDDDIDLADVVSVVEGRLTGCCYGHTLPLISKECWCSRSMRDSSGGQGADELRRD